MADTMNPTLCTCGHTEAHHSPHNVGKHVGRICSVCTCAHFVADSRTMGLLPKLEAAVMAVEAVLDELNTYKGRDRASHLPVWASGDDMRAHAEAIDVLEILEGLRATLRAGLWHGRTPN